MRERECIYNADIEKRISGREDWILYINPYYWVLDTDGNYEFYFTPTHFIGKIDKNDLPDSVIQVIKYDCVMFDYERLYKNMGKTKLIPSLEDLSYIDRRMQIGNWFYEQGYNYVTFEGRFIRRIDPYNITEECDFRNIDSDIVRDMLRMNASTRSHHIVKDVFGLGCFSGVDTSRIISKPLGEFTWNSEDWKTLFELVSADLRKYPKSECYRAEMRELRRRVYKHTVFVVRNGYYFSHDGEKIEFPDSRNLISGSKFYSQKISLNPDYEKHETEITVENLDSLTCAKKHIDEGFKPAVLNMANRQTPGGGVLGGAGAQEENIFRRTNAFMSMYQFADFAGKYNIPRSNCLYPMDRNFGGIYSPDVTVFRGEEKDGYPLLENYYRVSLVSVAAMNRPEIDSDGNIASYLVEGVKNKIRTVLAIAAENGHDSIVLGAMGCGAFRNPPSHIARLFHEIIDGEFNGRFKKITFAILEDHNSVRKDSAEGNFAPFYREFCEKT